MARNDVMTQLKRELQAKIDDAVDTAREQARKLAADIEAAAPVDTGALRNSVEVVNTPEGARVTVGGGSVDYADEVEQREPFVAPAVQAAQGGYEAAMRKAVR